MSDINWDNKEEVITAIKDNFMFVISNIGKINKNLLNDFEVGIKFVETYCYNLKLLSNELRNNYYIVKIAVAKDGRALEYASEELRNNFDIVTMAVAKDGYALKFASNEILENKEFISSLYNNYNKNVLQYASKKIQKQIIIENIENNVEELKFEELKFEVLKDVSFEILKDKDFMLELIKINYDAMKYIAKRYFRLYCDECE